MTRSVAVRLAVPLILLLALLGLKGHTLLLPIWGDGQAYIVPNGLTLLEQPATLFLEDEVHPPFYFHLEALAYRIFGTSLPVSHGLILFFAFLALYHTWRLGEILFGRTVGFAASLMLLSSSLFFCQSGLIRLSIPLTALTVMAIRYGLAGKPAALLFSGVALVLTKHPGVFIAFSIFTAVTLRSFRHREDSEDVITSRSNQKSRWIMPLAAAVPLAVFIIWVMLSRLHYGWFFHPENTADLGLDAGRILEGLRYRLQQLFLAKSMWLMLVLLPAGVYAVRTADRPRLPRTGEQEDDSARPILLYIVFLLPVVLFLAFFTAYSYDFPRYLLPVYPGLFILAAAGGERLLRGRPGSIPLLTLTLVLALLVGGWFRHFERPRPRLFYESDLAYLDVLEAKTSAASFLETEYAGELILTGKPVMDLTEPVFGYVKKPLRVIHLPRRLGIEPELFEKAGIYYQFSRTGPSITAAGRRRLRKLGIRPVLKADYSITGLSVKIYLLERMAQQERENDRHPTTGTGRMALKGR